MKRITRLVNHSLGAPTRYWLDQHGHWTRNESHAFVFDDAEAEKRVRRIPHAETEDAPNANPE